MKLIETKQIDDFLFTRIEYLHHTRNSYLFIINEILKKRSEYEYNKELLDYYLKEYREIDIKFNLTSQEIVETFFGQKYMSKKYYSEYDFIRRVINLYELEEEDESKRLGTIPRCSCENNE